MVLRSFLSPVLFLLASTRHAVDGFSPIAVQKPPVSPHAQQWLDDSLLYYNKITRGSPQEKRATPEHIGMAMHTYFAHTKVKGGKSDAAEKIYRRLVESMMEATTNDDCDCDFGRIAVPTLLLALLLQREKRMNDARVVFEDFHKSVTAAKVVKCSCSARVLQAYALFEMKQENPIKSLEILFSAIRLDKAVRPVLRWKQFRNALVLRQEHLAANRRLAA